MTSATTAGLMSSGGSTPQYDVNPDVELEFKNVRVLVMQEATSSFSAATLMVDSHALADSVPSSPILGSFAEVQRSARGSISNERRRTSITQQNSTTKPVIITQDHGRSYGGGAFDRRPSHGRQNSIHETDGQRSHREYREEINTVANCMFGASEVMAYKGQGTKMHILQPEARSQGASYHIDGLDGRGSLGRSSLRRSGLAQSFTTESMSTTTTTSAGARANERKRVLVTRIFPVPLPNDDTDSPGDTAHLGTSYPFPKDDGSEEPKRQPKQKRTPMYAIGLIIQLPPSYQQASNRSAYRNSVNPGSYTGNDSISSSFSSLKPSWSVARSDSAFESMESSYSIDGEDRIDLVTQHWDIIIRTLDRLQASTTAHLLQMLKQADLASPDPLQLGRGGGHHRTASISVAGKRVEENKTPVKPARTNVKCVQLMPYALANNETVKVEIEGARRRVLGGLSNLQVVTRQGRWGIWRDEARWVAKWAGSKEQGFFFYNLLTAFLGVHTEWLEAIGPTYHRRRHYKKSRLNSGRPDSAGVRTRTIIVSKDKMATRRLIFLLSAFLPNNQQHHAPMLRGRRDTSVSYLRDSGYSQSPSSYIASHREESLIRTSLINKSAKASNTVHPRHLSFPAQLPRPMIKPELREPHSRRASEVHITPPILPALPTVSSNLSIESSMAPASTATSTPGTTAAHISSAYRRPIRGTGPDPRPGSSGSLAADDLVRSLQGRNAAPKWQGMLGNFFGARRKESISSQDSSSLAIPGGGREGRQKQESEFARSPRSISVLEEMVQSAKKLELETQKHHHAEYTDAAENPTKDSNATDTSHHSQPQSMMKPSEAHPQPQQVQGGSTPPSHTPMFGATDSPVKTSVAADGTINIDFSLPSFLTQTLNPPSHFSDHSHPSRHTTAPSSVASSGILSAAGITSEIDSFEQYTRCGADDGSGTNVAGWLERWCPDFVLQGIPADNTTPPIIDEAVRVAMVGESTPLIHLDSRSRNEEEKWVTVAQSLIADTSHWTIKRVTLKRLVRFIPDQHAHRDKEVVGSFESKKSARSIYGNPYADTPPLPITPTIRGLGHEEEGQKVVDEKWEEEMCIAFDASLIDAVERVLERGESTTEPAQPTTPVVSAAEERKEAEVGIKAVIPNSEASSRDVSRPVSRPASIHGREAIENASNEVPRGEVRSVLLGALENLATEVAENRAKAQAKGEELGDDEAESFLREGVNGWLRDVEA